MDIASVEITCALCDRTFWWTTEEQAFFAKHAFVPPRLCRSCREWRKLPEGKRPATPPGIVALYLRCEVCGHSWVIGPLLRMNLKRGGKRIQSRCPSCRRAMRKAGRGAA